MLASVTVSRRMSLSVDPSALFLFMLSPTHEKCRIRGLRNRPGQSEEGAKGRYHSRALCRRTGLARINKRAHLGWETGPGDRPLGRHCTSFGKWYGIGDQPSRIGME